MDKGFKAINLTCKITKTYLSVEVNIILKESW